MAHAVSVTYRRPRESGGPGRSPECLQPWVLAYAGNDGLFKVCFVSTHSGLDARISLSRYTIRPGGRARSSRKRDMATWGIDWVWSLPLIVLTVVIHVLG